MRLSAIYKYWHFDSQWKKWKWEWKSSDQNQKVQEALSEPFQQNKELTMELFANQIWTWNLLQKQLTAETTIFTKDSILDVGQSSNHASRTNKLI